jgi:hypothetical protein
VNLEGEIIHNPEVVDLMVTLTFAAASQNRADHFVPFPTSLGTVDILLSICLYLFILYFQSKKLC